MAQVHVVVEDDPDHPEGGHALVVWEGASRAPGLVDMTLESADARAGLRLRATQVPATESARGVAVAIGPDIVERVPAHTPMLLRLPDINLAAEVHWPALRPLWKRATKRRTAADRPIVDKAATTDEFDRWKRIEAGDSEQDLRDHLARFPEGKTRPSARTRLVAVVWSKLGDAPPLAALDTFLTEFPDGAHAATAEAMRDKLLAAAKTERIAEEASARESDAWNKVADSTDIAALQDFLHDWAYGPHAAEAHARMAALLQAAAVARRPEEIAKTRESDVQPKVDDRERQAWDAVAASTDVDAVRRFLHEWPSGEYAALAKTRLASLSQASRPPGVDDRQVRRTGWVIFAMGAAAAAIGSIAVFLGLGGYPFRDMLVVNGSILGGCGGLTLALAARLQRWQSLELIVGGSGALLILIGIAPVAPFDRGSLFVAGFMSIASGILTLGLGFVMFNWRFANLILPLVSGLLFVIFIVLFLNNNSLAVVIFEYAVVIAVLGMIAAGWRAAGRWTIGLGAVMTGFGVIFAIATRPRSIDLPAFIASAVAFGTMTIALGAHAARWRAAKRQVVGTGIAMALAGTIFPLVYFEAPTESKFLSTLIIGSAAIGGGIFAIALGLLLDFPDLLWAGADAGPPKAAQPGAALDAP